ncbi:ribonuclease PH [Candidatus Dependentiae bacterium]|nr:ribonuclease PH [Candidatus Dependentiae bacterium]
MQQLMRSGQRRYNQIRPLKVTYDVLTYAAGSVLFEMGKTKVLCAVTCQQGVPHFLKGKKTGWLTAEYALLPASTPLRTVRDSNSSKKNGRTIEISRLIGRSLRSIINLEKIGEYTIFIDCDVLQADGGTRTASITGAYLALKAAVARWLEQGFIAETIITDELAAVSVGLSDGCPLLDIDFAEDSSVEADFNFVLTRSGKIVELQGTAEKLPITWQDYDVIRQIAVTGCNEIFQFFDNNKYKLSESISYSKINSIAHSYEAFLD